MSVRKAYSILTKTCKTLCVIAMSTVIGFILVLFGFRWFLICSLQVFQSQEKPSKTNINPLLSFRMVAAIGGGHCNNSTIQNEKYWRKVKSQDNRNSMKEKAKRPGKRVGRLERAHAKWPSYRNGSAILIGMAVPFLRDHSACPIGMTVLVL